MRLQASADGVIHHLDIDPGDGTGPIRGTVDDREYLLDVTNPGLWMAHCHIAEHTESGMMFSFEVTP